MAAWILTGLAILGAFLYAVIFLKPDKKNKHEC